MSTLARGFSFTSRLLATVGFHAAWDFGAHGREVTNRDATNMLYLMYPSPIRRWIAARGGLKPQMIFLRGKQLMSMYRPCYLDAQASRARTRNGVRPACCLDLAVA